MKYAVSAITTRDFQITIPDDLITDELFKEFNECMWTMDSKDDIIAYIIRMFVEHPDIQFIEGVGPSSLFKTTGLFFGADTEILSLVPIHE